MDYFEEASSNGINCFYNLYDNRAMRNADALTT